MDNYKGNEIAFLYAFKDDFCITNIQKFIVSLILVKHRINKISRSVMFSEIIGFVLWDFLETYTY